MRVRERWIALGAPNLFDGLLRGFFDRAGRVIFESPNPLTAMRDFWEGKPLRGRRREDNLERNRTITAAVQDRVETGEENEKAIAAVAEAFVDMVHSRDRLRCYLVARAGPAKVRNPPRLCENTGVQSSRRKSFSISSV